MICIEGCAVFSDMANPSSHPPKIFKIPNQFGTITSRKPVDQITCCAFSQDGQYFAWDLGLGYIGILKGDDCNIDLNNFEETIKCCSRIIDSGENVSSLLFVPTMKNVAKLDKVSLLAVGLSKGPIKLFNILTGVLVNILFDHSMSVTDMTICRNGSSLLVSCSLDKTLKVWDFEESGNMCLTMKGHKMPIKSCSFSPCNNNMIASVGDGREVIIWTLRDKRHVQGFFNLIGHKNDVTSCSWSPDGALLASASHDSTVIIWDVYKKKKLWILGHHYPMPSSIYAGGANGYWVSCVSFSSDGKKVVTTCEDSKFVLFYFLFLFLFVLFFGGFFAFIVK